MASDLEIVQVEQFKVPPRWLFVKVTTTGGLSGWGEPIVEGRADTVKAAVEELAGYLIGERADRIEDLWQVLYRGGFYRGGPILMSALAGINQALWDIKGRAAGLPVYSLLGGPVRDKMKIYTWIGGDKPSGVAEAALQQVEAGFTAVKMNASAAMEWIDTTARTDDVIRRAAAVREAVGPEVGMALDFHGRVHRGVAKTLVDELAPLKPMFIEEPVLPEHSDILPALQQQTSIPIATGERMYSRWDFKPVLEAGAVDVVQPDVSHAGGISEVVKIASMAEAYDVALAPHCPLGPIAFAAALQVDFTCLNAVIQETSRGIHYNQEYDLTDYLSDATVFAMKDGHVLRPEGPGLGITIDEDRVREMSRVGHSWTNPIWRHEDGSFAEW